jgi:hypothetical protein
MTKHIQIFCFFPHGALLADGTTKFTRPAARKPVYKRAASLCVFRLFPRIVDKVSTAQ